MDNDNVVPIRPEKIIAWAGGVIDRTRVTMGIYGEDLDPAEISVLLKCKPSSSHRRGDSRRGNAGLHQKGAWLLSVEGEAPHEPEELLKLLLAQLPRDPSIWVELNQRFAVHLGFGLFLDSWNRGFDLSPTVVERVASIGATLGFDIYSPSGEDDG